LAVIIAHWAPTNERGKMMGFINAGKWFSFLNELYLTIMNI
jgi:sugar phosphate permease